MRFSPNLPQSLRLTVAGAFLFVVMPCAAFSQKTSPSVSSSSSVPPSVPLAANPDDLYAPFAAEFAHITDADKAFKIGKAAADTKQDGRAGAAFTRALALRHLYPGAVYNRELASERLKQWRAAIVDLDRLIRDHPKGPVFYFQRSTAYSNLGDRAKAVADHEKGGKLWPVDSDAVWGRTSRAEFTRPKKPPIPDSLKDKEFNTSVIVQVVFGWDGHASTTLKKSAGPGLTALDDVALKALSEIKFKAAQEDGLLVDSEWEFEIKYTNPPQPKQPPQPDK